MNRWTTGEQVFWDVPSGEVRRVTYRPAPLITGAAVQDAFGRRRLLRTGAIPSYEV